MKKLIIVVEVFFIFAVVFSVQAEQAGIATVTPAMQCSDIASADQDDMCIWIHPVEPQQSAIIISDKKANSIILYDLEGKTIQTVPVKHPGNIDIRYDFPFGGGKTDIIAFNLRDESRIAIYKIDPKTRKIERIDNEQIQTGHNYGGTLYHSSKTGKFYFITTSDEGNIEQYELSDDNAGKVKGVKVRSWTIGKTEAAVADDEKGQLYLAEEQKGIWKLGAEPDSPTPGKLIDTIGSNGLTGDMEGVAIYYLPGGDGYLIASNQGSGNFKVYRRTEPHEFLGTFAVAGVSDTDGIDVCNAALGKIFPYGFFACHTGTGRCPTSLIPWQNIAGALKLEKDTSWNVRKIGH